MKVIITITFCYDNLWKVSLWLWKSLENSGKFFLYYNVASMSGGISSCMLRQSLVSLCTVYWSESQALRLEVWCSETD